MESVASNFYVYRYNRPDGTPYYIGKGNGRRAFSWNRRIRRPIDRSRIVFVCKDMTEEEAFDLEVSQILRLGRKDLGTGILRNLTGGGEGVSGLVVSEAHRAKISAANTGKPQHAATKAALLKANTGSKRSDEARAKMSAKWVGRVVSDETRARMSASAIGRSFSDEHRASLKAARQGRVFSDETRAKMSAAQIGKTHSAESKAKMSAARKGKPKSAEAISRLTAARAAKRAGKTT